MFSPFETRLSHVRRWPITRTIRQQSVAEHSFRVALWADRIAKKYFNITGAVELYQITRFALLHDQLEAFTGDAPSSVKPVDWDDVVYDRFRTKIMEHPNGSDAIYTIIKIADMCEAIIYLHEESSMGNHSILGLMEYCKSKLRERVIDQKMYRELLINCETAAAYKQEPLND